MEHRAIRVCTLTLGLMVLSGCVATTVPEGPSTSGPDPTASESTSPAPSPTAVSLAPAASPSPTPTPPQAQPVTPPAPFLDPDYDYSSFLGATMNGTASDASEHIGLDLVTDTECAWIATFDFPLAAAPIEVGVWESVLGAPDDHLVFFMGGDPTPGAYDGMEPYLNAEGVGLGTSAAQVLAAYPGATIEANEYPSVGSITEILVPGPGGEGMYNFWVAGPDGEVYQVFWGDVDPAAEARGYYCYSEV